jgi:hypothetical protein
MFGVGSHAKGTATLAPPPPVAGKVVQVSTLPAAALVRPRRCLSAFTFLTRNTMLPVSATQPSPVHHRYRVFLREELVYTVDVIALDEEHAREIALETETRDEPECRSFDVDALIRIEEADADFNPINECSKCQKIMDDSTSPHCPACIEAIKAERRA